MKKIAFDLGTPEELQNIEIIVNRPTVQHEARPPTKSRRMDNHTDGLMIKLNLHQLVLRRSEYNCDIVT